MKFILKLYDRKGTELKEGDVVKVSNGKRFSFFAEVTYLKDEQILAPFHTFSFHSFEKIKSVPDNAVKSTEERYNIWYVYDDQAEIDEESKDFENYLSGWRECENMINDRCFRIEKTDK